MALNNKQQLFVDSYLQCFNATKAALDAGYAQGSAYAHGHKLLKNAEISEAISQRLTESAMSADEVLMRLAEQARGEHSKYISKDGYVKIADLVADGKAHLIKEIEEAKDGTTKYKFYDAQSALNTLAKHHGLLTDYTGRNGDKDKLQVEHSGEVKQNHTIDKESAESIFDILAAVGVIESETGNAET